MIDAMWRGALEYVGVTLFLFVVFGGLYWVLMQNEEKDRDRY